MILGTEEFHRLPPPPFAQQNGLAALQRLVELMQPPELQLIVHYQMPRSVLWINILWKQSDIHHHHRITSYPKLLCVSHTTLQTNGLMETYYSTHRNMVWKVASTVLNLLFFFEFSRLEIFPYYSTNARNHC
jgi:hypothetical protein